MASSDPLTELIAVTKSDSTVYDPPLRGVMITVAGDLAVIGRDNTTAVTITGLAVGIWHPMVVTKVMSTNTAATGIFGGR